MADPVTTQDPAPTAPTAPEWPMTVPLRKPLLDKDAQQIRELVLREPTGGDIAEAGNPVKMRAGNDGVIEFVYDEAKMTAMFAKLSGVPPVFLRNIDPRDWNTLAYRISGFFLPDLG